MATKTILPALLGITMMAGPNAHAATRAALPMAAEGGFADIVEKTLPSVVQVITIAAGSRGKSAGEGSGVIISEDGYLLTNYHVVDGAASVTVRLADERELPAKLIAADAPADLAVLKIEARGLQPVEFGDSSRARIGDYVLAIGNPFGIGTTVTLGILSAKGEGDYLQTDAAINPGNSGGPLLNIKGELIGINTAIISPSGGSTGVGLALPSNIAKSVMSELIAKGRVDRGYLGAGFQPLTEPLQQALGVSRGGALIAEVAPDSPAAAAGLHKGDVLVAINGRVLRDFRRLQLVAAQSKPDSRLELTIARRTGDVVVPVTLGRRPAEVPILAVQEVIPGAALADSGSGGRGPVVTMVDPQGVSAEAGLRPGDIIVAADWEAVTGLAGLQAKLAKSSGKPLLLEINRGGSTYFVAVPLS
jgi:Do/DeqQ family serine protease